MNTANGQSAGKDLKFNKEILGNPQRLYVEHLNKNWMKI